jgi:hypothetical protein
MSESLTPEELERFDKIIPLLIYGDKLVETEKRVKELESELRDAKQAYKDALRWRAEERDYGSLLADLIVTRGVTCGQCGQEFTERPCGFAHTVIAGALAHYEEEK